jgi:hypothetical protein
MRWWNYISNHKVITVGLTVTIYNFTRDMDVPLLWIDTTMKKVKTDIPMPLEGDRNYESYRRQQTTRLLRELIGRLGQSTKVENAMITLSRHGVKFDDKTKKHISDSINFAQADEQAICQFIEEAPTMISFYHPNVRPVDYNFS